MKSDTYKRTLECIRTVRQLAERMSKEDAYGGEWAIRADYYLLDMLDYLEQEEEKANARD